MMFLPIVARELRVASRRHATYWSRAVMAVLTIVAGGIVLGVSGDRSSPHELGMVLFLVLCWLAYIYCLATGMRSTADCLSEEKREGTLGLLFLTDLKGYDVVGGKLVATSLNTFFGLLAIFPVLAIPLLMGGVTNKECWRAALVLINTLFFSLSAGMFMSAISTSPRKALGGTTSFILLITLGLPMLEWWVPAIYHSDDCKFALHVINPDWSMIRVPENEFSTAPTEFWWSLGGVHGLSWFLLILSSLIVPRSWQDKPSGVKMQSWRATWRQWSFGDATERLAYRKRLLDINAFFWLAARTRLKPMYVWIYLILLACLWSWGAAENGNNWINPGIYFLTAFVLNSTIKAWVASEAGQRLGDDRRIGALELLLSTRLSVADIVRGQLLALKRQFLAPVLVVVIVQTVLLLITLQGGRTDHSDVEPTVMVALAFIVVLMADLAALASVGMWVSLTAKNPLHATGTTIRRILLMPWALVAAVFIACSILEANGYRQNWTYRAPLALYFITSLTVDIWFGTRAWKRLHAEFRDVAARRFDVRRTFWGGLGWRLGRLFAGAKAK